MVNYRQGKIYVIRSHKTDDVYIGSTCEPTLARRMAGHRTTYKCRKKTGNKYVSSFEILKHGDAYIELLEAFPCDTKDELLRREGALIRETKCVNKDIAGRTMAEYYQDNKEAISAQKKIYRQNNATKLATLRKKYREDNKAKIQAHANRKIVCPCGVSFTRSHRARHLRTAKHKAYEATQ